MVVDDEDFVARLIDRGTPEPVARLFLGSFRASRLGEFAVTGPTLGTLLGHGPQPIRAALQAVAE